MSVPIAISVLGATGNLGRQVCRQALDRGWQLSVGVRTRGRLEPETAARARIFDLDLAAATVGQLASFLSGHVFFVCCAGVVTEGEASVQLFDKAMSAVQALPASSRPVSWFMAGAALLPLDARGRLVPEPFSWALMLAGLGLVGCAARRQQARINDRRSTL